VDFLGINFLAGKIGGFGANGLDGLGSVHGIDGLGIDSLAPVGNNLLNIFNGSFCILVCSQPFHDV